MEIFKNCLSEEDDALDIRNPPWLLTRVCSRWSNVAVTTSILWCNITLFVHSHSKPLEHITAQSSLLNLHLQRSANQPLSLSLDFHKALLKEHECSTLDLLIQQAYRWESVEFWSLNQTILRKVQTSLVKGSTPMLKSLVFYLSTSPGPVWDTFEICPSLRSLALYQCFDSIQVRIPWGQLTHFTARKLGVGHVMDMLRSMPALVECTIHEHTDPIGYSISGIAPINLPHLRIFNVDTLKETLRASMQEILQYLYMPALIDLRVRVRAKLPAYDVDISSFLCCYIDKLSLNVGHGRAVAGIPEDDIIAILPNLPVLQELKIRCFHRISDDFLIHLFTTREDGPEICLCPSLKSFVFEGPVGVGDYLGMITKDYMDYMGIRIPSALREAYLGLQWKAPLVITRFTSLPAPSSKLRYKGKGNRDVDWMIGSVDGHPCYW